MTDPLKDYEETIANASANLLDLRAKRTGLLKDAETVKIELESVSKAIATLEKIVGKTADAPKRKRRTKAEMAAEAKDKREEEGMGA
jgi:predicted  nucleic acid-binding Zn-ribbon protein